ncbi:hypothetical protein AQUCO_00100092v1 [Aquilegia coerulea]|uniref:Uncharacterized protein n=1 Tax=Aquilegia coerulea TaxID=218851 RepID=A0A2G5F8Q3_AQUCA|nr:hypothetical protein AQUCO_00100092v1 [Aquilegia coerulea]
MEKADDIQSQCNDVPTRFISSKEGLGSSKILLAEKTYLASSPLEEHQTHSNEHKSASEKTPSNGPLPRVSASKIKTQTNNVKRDIYLKGPSIYETNMENTETNKQNIGRELSLFSVRKPSEVNLQQNVMHVRSQTQVSLNSQAGASGAVPIPQSSKQLKVSDARPATVKGYDSIDHVDCNKEKKLNTHKRLMEKFSGTSEAEVATVSGRILDDAVSKEHIQSVKHEEQGSRLDVLVQEKNSSEQFDCNIQHKKENIDRQETLSEELVETSEAEETTLLEHPVRTEHTHTPHHEQQGSAFSGLEESEWKTYGDNSDKLNTSENSFRNLRSLEYLGVEQEAMGSRISPDETRRLCLTTASKEMIDFVRGYGEIDQRDLESSRLEDEKKV